MMKMEYSQTQETTRKRARRPNAQPFDEVRMFIKPRFKMSVVSGNEWRTRIHVICKHKGNEVLSFTEGTMREATKKLKIEINRMEQVDPELYLGKGSSCDQEGCANLADYIYKVKKKFDQNHTETDANEGLDHIVVRHFCERHSVRGNYSNQSDNDNNYLVIQSPPSGLVFPPKSDLSVIRYPTTMELSESSNANKNVPITASYSLCEIWGVAIKGQFRGEWVCIMKFDTNDKKLALQIAEYRTDIWPLQVRQGDLVIKEFGTKNDNK
ncbi:hypothetical protein KAU11_11465 [Candidatus Babeliales bacterium]|nr:hypothetical protein [Candidatus Babeliales bacterium]